MKKFFLIAVLVFSFFLAVSCSAVDEDLDDLGDLTDTENGNSDANSGSDPADTGNSDTGSADTGSADTGSADTGNSDTGDTGDTGSNQGGDTGDTGTDSGDTGTNPGSDTGDSGSETPDQDTVTPEPEPDNETPDQDTVTPEPDNETGDDDTETGDSEPEPDDSDTVDPDDPEGCTVITLNSTLSHYDHGYVNYGVCYQDIYSTGYTTSAGAASGKFYIKFYAREVEFKYEGTYILAGTNWSNLKGLFLYVKEGTKTFFQKKGTVEVGYSEWGLTHYSISPKLSGVVLEEVEIDSDTNVSKPVDDGTCLKIKDTEFYYSE